MLKKFALMSAVSLFAMGTALAQAPTTPPATSSPPAASEPKSDMKASETKSDMKPGGAQSVSAQKPDQWMASKFKGTDVMGPDDQKVGDISDILFDKDGTKIEAFIVSVGGFLGMGSKEIALAPSAFQSVPADPNSATSSPKLKISMTKDQLKDAPNFEPYKEPSRTTTGTGGGAPKPGGMSK
jgi:sporulation protein YlmC with PRC-barrel domain